MELEICHFDIQKQKEASIPQHTTKVLHIIIQSKRCFLKIFQIINSQADMLTKFQDMWDVSLESLWSMVVEESETEHEFDFGDTLENEFDFDENYTPSMLMQTKFTRQPEMATRETSRFN